MTFSPLTIFGRGWLYRYILFSLLAIFGQEVIISWHYIFTPGNIWWGGVLTIFSEGVNIFIIFSLLIIFGEGVTISWHYIFTPGNIWWGDEYIVTLYVHSWQYLVRGWLYRDIFSLLKIFGQGVIISWHYNIISDTTLESGTGGDYIWILSHPNLTLQWHQGLLFIAIYSPHETRGGLNWLYLCLIPSLLLKLSVLVDMLMDCINSLCWTKIC